MPEDTTTTATPTTPDPDLALRLTQTEHLLTESKAALADSQRTLAIERALTAHGALDFEATSALIPADAADIQAAVADLKVRKPFLFRQPAVTAAAMAAAAGSERALDTAADTARQTGDRRALLRYLRLKRAG